MEDLKRLELSFDRFPYEIRILVLVQPQMFNDRQVTGTLR